jgi:DNA-binding NtrC family response regulator
MKIVSNDARNPQSDIKKRILLVEDQFIEAHDLQLILEKANYEVMGIVRSVEQALELIHREKPDLVFLDIMLKGTQNGIELAHMLKEDRIAFIFVSANSSKQILDQAKTTQPYGFIVKPFREQDVLTTLEIAFYRQQYSLESQLMQQLQLKNDITAIINSRSTWEESLLGLASKLKNFISYDYLEAGYANNTHYDYAGVIRKNVDHFQLINIERLTKITEISIKELNEMYKKSKLDLEPIIYSEENLIKNFQDAPIKSLIAHNFGIKSYLVFPIATSSEQKFYLTFYSRCFNIYSQDNLRLLSNSQDTLRSFIDIIYPNKVLNKNEKSKTDFSKANVNQDKSAIEFKGIVGKSPLMMTVFDYIQKVAPSDTSVLVLGESGTGKEKIAQSIHGLSPRKEKPLITINCGAIPENLAESLLFGHERGSFTGALEMRAGKFELADGSTIFLDEIGEMSPELQVKLLRVLQEKEIERIGGKSPLKVDVRIIAATNKNLEDEVAAGRFRMDLYYRLHVFPILVPPLRKRIEDIPDLAHHFINMYSKKMNKKAPMLSDKALQQITNYSWPGNIRELEHAIQRAILLTEGNVIKEIEVFSASKIKDEQNNETTSIKTILENERDYIIHILKKCNGKVSGAGGAAEVLNIHPSTLNSKIKKLDIKNS